MPAKSTAVVDPSIQTKGGAAAGLTAKVFGSFAEITAFIWSIADLLRGTYKQADYRKVILPLTVLRRLDCVLASATSKMPFNTAIPMTMRILT